MRTKSTYDRFPTVKRGYDPQAVESYLAGLTTETDQTLDEAARQIAALEIALEESQGHEEAVHLTIVAATKTKEGMLEVAQRQADELRSQGRKDADRVITDARMQAFQVVTEARAEAEAVVAEARAEVAALARADAETARLAGGPSDGEVASQQRIEEMQAVIEAMEVEIRSHYAAPNPSRGADPAASAASIGAANAPSAETAPPTEDDDSVAAQRSTRVEEVHEERIEIIVTDTAPAMQVTEPRPTSDESETSERPARRDSTPRAENAEVTDDQASAVRRSFYSRRSANLPRIGVEAGHGAMAAAAGLRASLIAADTDDAAAKKRSPEYEAV